MRMQGVLASGPGARGRATSPTSGAAEYEDLRNRAALDRERLLMYAVLEDALSCYRQYAKSRLPRTRQLHQEAREWVASDDRSSLFAFREHLRDARHRPGHDPLPAPGVGVRNGLPGPIGAPPRSRADGVSGVQRYEASLGRAPRLRPHLAPRGRPAPAARRALPAPDALQALLLVYGLQIAIGACMLMACHRASAPFAPWVSRFLVAGHAVALLGYLSSRRSIGLRHQRAHVPLVAAAILFAWTGRQTLIVSAVAWVGFLVVGLSVRSDAAEAGRFWIALAGSPSA
jgi:hypothetical protein